MLNICNPNSKNSQKMQNQTTKKKKANTDETKLRDTKNTSSRSNIKLLRL